MSGTWHVDAQAVAAYGARRLGPVERASVESHAVRCSSCRTALAEGAVGARMGLLDAGQLWDRIEARVEEPPLGHVGRLLRRVGLPMPDLVVLRVVGAQSRQWTIATTLVLLLTAVAAVLGPVDDAHVGFLVVAPLLPALGVAATYRLVPPGVGLIEVASPYAPARMLLWRTAYVVATAVPVAVVAGTVVLRHPGAAVSWLLPSLACTLCVAVAATRSDPARPAAVVGLGWTAIVVAWQVRATPWAIATPTTQLVALAVSVVAAAVLHRRLDGPTVRPAARGA